MPRESPVAIAARVDAALPETITEDLLAQEFTRLHARDFRYVPGGGYYLWIGHKWERDEKLRHFHEMRKIARARAGEVTKRESRRIAAAKTVTAMATLARSDPLLIRGTDEFDADPLILNTPGGIVDLQTGEIRPHDRDLVTKSTAVTPALGSRCPTWLRFLDQVFEGQRNVTDFVYRFLGYCLTGLTREHVLGFFFGDGGNGKSTLLDFLLWLLGDYALKLPASVLMAQRGERHPTELAQFLGIRFAVSSEIEEGGFWAEARLKELTGDTTLTARYVRGDFFTFRLLCKIVISGNHRPQVRSVDDALKRRLLLVPFAAKFTGEARDLDMLEKLKAEGPAVLASLIEGCREYLEHGLQVPESIRAASDEYVETMDSVGNWLKDCCRVTGDPFDSESASLLYRSYGDWKRARGETAVGQTRLSEQLKSRGHGSYRNNGIRYRGLELTASERERISAANADKNATQ